MSTLPVMPNLIIIGGSSRNVGKTTLTLKLIEKYAAEEKITGLKVTNVRPGEEAFHGDHDNLKIHEFRILEETLLGTGKDTSRMLQAGAANAFFIETTDHLISEAFREFLYTGYNGGLIICESRSLRNVVVPGLFVLLKHYNEKLIKPGFNQYEEIADIVFSIDRNLKNSGALAERISWDGISWNYRENSKNQAG
ncbi:MAG: hypothetical protein V1775_06975 [Bacteroidota bacterium]